MSSIKIFEGKAIRSYYNEETETWYFSLVDIVQALTESVNPTDYLKKLRKRDTELNTYIGTNCPQVEMLTNIIHKEWAGLTVKQHKNLKGLKSQNLRDHMSEAELIFTALAELSTRQIAETEQAKGLQQNAVAGKKGGAIAKNARKELEAKTGKSVITNSNFLPPKRKK